MVDAMMSQQPEVHFCFKDRPKKLNRVRQAKNHVGLGSRLSMGPPE
jgi:hypothetical protein